VGNQMPIKATVVTGAKTNTNQQNVQLALMFSDGTDAGLVKPQTAPANSVATTVAGAVTDLNALIAVLKTAGVLK
jgi:hypothetical protein